MQPDCLIIGGGVIGLSLAYELAVRGESVRVVDRGQLGREASWAGAGIVPPGPKKGFLDGHDRLLALSSDLHARWAQRLREETGVDNGYRRCGGLYLALHAHEAQGLASTVGAWREQGIAVRPSNSRPLPPAELIAIEPALAAESEPAVRAAWFLEDEAQIRNPRHVKALVAACVRRGVVIDACSSAEDFEINGQRVAAVRTTSDRIVADRVCVTAGAWTTRLLARWPRPPRVRPVRGQIVLLACTPGRLTRIINHGKQYIVPRADGRVLIGSTEENVGFDKRTTAAGIGKLLNWAIGVVPALADGVVEQTWAGLRPASEDGLPYLGRMPGVDNLFVAAGHFRSGLQLSTGTAVAMANLVRGEPPPLDLTPFRLDRDIRSNRD